MELLEIGPHNIQHLQGLILGEQNAFLLCHEGEVRIVVDERETRVAAHCLYIFPSFVELQTAACSEGTRASFGLSDHDFVLSALSGTADKRSIIDLRFHSLVSLDEAQMERIGQLLHLFIRRQRLVTPLASRVMESLAQTFCFEVLDAYNANYRPPSAKQSRKDMVFCNFLTALYANFHQHREVAFYASQQCLTPRYFSTLVHNLSGRKASDWISMFVTLEARKMLTDGKMSVKEIANRLNFPSQSFFCRYFRQHVGCTPLEYRSPTGLADVYHEAL